MAAGRRDSMSVLFEHGRTFANGDREALGSQFMMRSDNQTPGRSYIKFDTYETDSDELSTTPKLGKKRRLTIDQVRLLEKNFELENKLEPERKLQLANDLGLEPRQVAIWFQNRRARSKTKHLEKEYESLKSSYDTLKLDHDNLAKENDKLKSEVLFLTDKLLKKEEADQARKQLETYFDYSVNSSSSRLEYCERPMNALQLGDKDQAFWSWP